MIDVFQIYYMLICIMEAEPNLEKKKNSETMQQYVITDIC